MDETTISDTEPSTPRPAWRPDGPFAGGGLGVLRIALSVIVGYLIMAMLVMSTMFLAVQMMDIDAIFEQGFWVSTSRWNTIVVMISLLSAIAGGAVCERIANNRMGIRLLSIVFVVAMIGSLVTVLRSDSEPEPAPRPTTEALAAAAAEADQSPKLYAMIQAGKNAREPGWLKVANPACGFVGALLGSMLARRQTASRQS
ncbi:MAG: hypothetical protein FJ254_09180 [Phycisphaerae bacterium]|nr:hypothetical protein [Phycisphaerae bacterium]